MRSLRLDVLYVTGVVGSRSVAYEGDKTPPLCLGARQQAARAAGLGGRSTRPSNSLHRWSHAPLQTLGRRGRCELYNASKIGI